MVQKTIEKIKTGEVSEIYVIHGNDDYLIQLIKNALNQVIPEDERAMNLVTYHMQETSISVILEEARSLPFFGDKKLIFVEETQFLSAEKMKNISPEEMQQLVEYINDPNPNTIIVFLTSSIDSRKKLVKTLQIKATVVGVEALTDFETMQFVQQSITSSGYRINRETLEQLLQKTDYQLGRCMLELEKLYLASLPEKQITQYQVDQLVSKGLETNLFSLVDYLLKKDVQQTLDIFHDLVLQKEEPIKITAILISQFRLFIQVAILTNKRYQQSDMAKQLKQHPYRVKLAYQQVSRYSLTKLFDLYQLLVTLDFQLKTVNTDKTLLMEMTLLKMMSKEDA